MSRDTMHMVLRTYNIIWIGKLYTKSSNRKLIIYPLISQWSASISKEARGQNFVKWSNRNKNNTVSRLTYENWRLNFLMRLPNDFVYPVLQMNASWPPWRYWKMIRMGQAIGIGLGPQWGIWGEMKKVLQGTSF